MATTLKLQRIWQEMLDEPQDPQVAERLAKARETPHTDDGRPVMAE